MDRDREAKRPHRCQTRNRSGKCSFGPERYIIQASCGVLQAIVGGEQNSSVIFGSLPTTIQALLTIAGEGNHLFKSSGRFAVKTQVLQASYLLPVEYTSHLSLLPVAGGVLSIFCYRLEPPSTVSNILEARPPTRTRYPSIYKALRSCAIFKYHFRPSWFSPCLTSSRHLSSPSWKISPP